jgi:hypothetical protein
MQSREPRQQAQACAHRSPGAPQQVRQTIGCQPSCLTGHIDLATTREGAGGDQTYQPSPVVRRSGVVQHERRRTRRRTRIDRRVATRAISENVRSMDRGRDGSRSAWLNAPTAASAAPHRLGLTRPLVERGVERGELPVRLGDRAQHRLVARRNVLRPDARAPLRDLPRAALRYHPPQRARDPAQPPRTPHAADAGTLAKSKDDSPMMQLAAEGARGADARRGPRAAPRREASASGAAVQPDRIAEQRRQGPTARPVACPRCDGPAR